MLQKKKGPVKVEICLSINRGYLERKCERISTGSATEKQYKTTL